MTKICIIIACARAHGVGGDTGWLGALPEVRGQPKSALFFPLYLGSGARTQVTRFVRQAPLSLEPSLGSLFIFVWRASYDGLNILPHWGDNKRGLCCLKSIWKLTFNVHKKLRQSTAVPAGLPCLGLLIFKGGRTEKLSMNPVWT